VRQVRLNPTIQQNVVTYDVVVAVDNREQILMPGMTAYVNIVLAE
jgi:HlyD family secretion protein